MLEVRNETEVKKKTKKNIVRVVFKDNTSTVFDYFLKPQLDLHFERCKQIKALTVNDRLFLKKTLTDSWSSFYFRIYFVMKCHNLL